MLTLEKKWNICKGGQTIDDFKKIEEGKYCQLINGEIIMSPSPSSKHQDVSATIFTQIFFYVQKHKLGKAFYAPIDVYFND